MKAATEAVYLPMLFLTVALLGGLRVDERVTFVPPPLFALVLGMMLFGVLVRGRVLAPERLMSASRMPLENLNGLVVILSTFFAAAQIFNLVTPETGLPFLLFNVFLFVLLVNTLAAFPDRVSVLRSMAVITGAAFILKFIVLGAISDPGEGVVKRVLYVLLEGVTLGTLSQPVLHPVRRVYRVCDALVIPRRAGDAAGSNTQRGADKIGRVTPTRVFLLSPANCRGRRAQQVLSPKAAFSVAARLRSDGVPIGELFAHMSGLYFRGKITYARKFGRAFVITPDQGLLPAETTITSQVLTRFADAEIDLGNPGYRTPLEQTARELGEAAGADAQFVLLGSIASDKYVQVLSAIFGQRLVFPATFVGRGDMSRGGVLLRAAAASQELEYIPVIGAVRHGARPPRLPR